LIRLIKINYIKILTIHSSKNLILSIILLISLHLARFSSYYKVKYQAF
jgi:hypothetical protein